MPIYEYQCQSCGHAVEIMHKMSETPSKECPACHKPELSRQISAAGFRLAGGGWYETDFKSGGKKNLADSGGSDGGAGKSSACASCPANS